jgi:hypothetical protein
MLLFLPHAYLVTSFSVMVYIYHISHTIWYDKTHVRTWTVQLLKQSGSMLNKVVRIVLPPHK